MGINTKFDGSFHEVSLAGLADEMLAQVVADHVAERFRPANRANTATAGTMVPYSVAVNGRVVHRGAGDLFPKNQVALAIHQPGRVAMVSARRMPVVMVDWAWERLSGNVLQRAIDGVLRLQSGLSRIENAADFVRVVLNGRDDLSGLLRFLLLRQAQGRYPALFARLDQAKALYRVYRIARTAGGLIAGADEARGGDPDVLAWIAQELRDRSPIVSGAYRDAHELYADGAPLMNAADVTEDMDLPEAEEFSFTNTVPYARKIEFGKTKDGRDFVIQVPAHVYERVAEDARARFGNVADIQYERRAMLGGEQVRQSRAASTRRPQRAATGVRESRLGRVHGQTAHNDPDVRFPSIVVRF